MGVVGEEGEEEEEEEVVVVVGEEEEEEKESCGEVCWEGSMQGFLVVIVVGVG